MKTSRFIFALFATSLTFATFAAALTEPQHKALIRHVERINPEALGLMLDDWETTWKPSPASTAAREWLKTLPERRKAAAEALKQKTPEAVENAQKLLTETRRVALGSPLFKDLEILAISRDYGGNARKEGNPAQPGLSCYNLSDVNKNIPSSIIRIGNFAQPEPSISTVFKPEGKATIASLDLFFDASRALFVSKGPGNFYHLYETTLPGGETRRISPDGINYDICDSCYLPDGRIIMTSTASEQGLPCESGRLAMTSTYNFNPKTGEIRRLTFDQDSNWTPSIMDDGRVMFVRWEYCDISHFFSRIIMTMRPDGTRQLGYFGSNGFWPNHYTDPRPIPGAPAQFVSVVTGHHTQKAGRLCLFDVRNGRAEAAGAVQMIPGRGKPIPERVEDYLYAGNWPRFLQPYPLGTSPKTDGAGKYFLVSMRPSGEDLWGIYLVDIFDNMTLLCETEGTALNQPLPLKARKRPPAYPDTVNLNDKNCTVHVADIYQGPGLRGVPRGTVKSIRVFAYHYAYIKAGSHEGVGTESSWDMKYVLGTVPVQADGSAHFIAPANTPIALQPLDANGAAVQLMRSWLVGMPGERVACIGCHENANSIMTVPTLRTKPVAIQPQGPKARTWSFMREVQPILQRRCAGCHDSSEGNTQTDTPCPNLADITPTIVPYRDGMNPGGAGAFTRSYHDLNPYVRRPGPESDNHLFNPMEYHANTSPLIQLLRKNHHGVTLTPAEWQTLYTWIDLNAPFWGTWLDFAQYWANEFHRNWIGIRGPEQQMKRVEESRARRNAHAQKHYAWDPATDPELDRYTFDDAKRDLAAIAFQEPRTGVPRTAAPALEGWPRSETEGQRREFDLPGGKLAFRRIPAGKFVMGDSAGYPDETPHIATIQKPFLMAELELPNRNFTAFKPDHYSGYIDTLGKDHTNPGINAMQPDSPVIRVSWEEAQAYCAWLSEKLGKKVRLPTEAEWEYAARAGTATPFYWGGVKDDFSPYANLADKALDKIPNQRQTLNYYLREMAFDDGNMVSAPATKYKPNAFGLKNMIGNVNEWTQSRYQPYPYSDATERNDRVNGTERVARGGSWDLLPRFSRVSVRTPYFTWQRVANVGIRLVIEE